MSEQPAHPYDAVLFDWEGVMTSPDNPGFDWIVRAIAAKSGASINAVNQAATPALGKFMRGQLNEAEFWQTIERDAAITLPPDFCAAMWHQWTGAAPLPTMVELVAQARRAGYRVVVFSNTIPPLAAMIRRSGGYDSFDAEVLSCDVGAAKPDAAIYATALQVAAAPARRILYVDDKARNLAPAEALGMTTLLAVDPVQTHAAILEALQLND